MYTPGTKCVITWVAGARFTSIGQIVTCLQLTYISHEWPQLAKVPRGMLCQQIDVPSEGSCVVHPIDWMQPFEDSDEHSLYDETIEDLVTDIVELTK